jgi:ribA/ribD-fused uncharacterized protein
MESQQEAENESVVKEILPVGKNIGEGYFWDGHSTRTYMTNGYESAFVMDKMKFISVSRYMWYMRAKAWRPNTDLATLIREAPDENTAKQLSRRCTSASTQQTEEWRRVRLKVMAKAVLMKFECSPDLRRRLIATGRQRLLFASKFDAFYGIGFTMKEARERRDEWGKNHLGEMLMLVRRRLVERGEQ